MRIPGVGLPGPARRALGNALDSLDEISRAVRQRAHLSALLEAPSAPGDLAALDEAECMALLASRSVGRLAYVARAGVPDVVPVNYAVRDGVVLVRTGPGPKLQAAERGDLVAFEVDDVDEASRTGWSVVVHGRASMVPTDGTADGPPSPWASGPRERLLQITPRRTTGRRLLGEDAAGPEERTPPGP